MKRLSWFLLLTLAGACKSKDNTNIVVEVWSDLAIPTRLNAIRIEVSGPTASHSEAFPLTGPNQLPVRLALVPRAAKDAQLTVRAVGLLGNSEFGGEAIRVAFVPGASKLLKLLVGQDCASVRCVASQSCSGGGCIPIPTNPNLPDYDPKAPAIGPDAGAPTGADSGSDVVAGGGAEAGTDRDAAADRVPDVVRLDAPVLLDGSSGSGGGGAAGISSTGGIGGTGGLAGGSVASSGNGGTGGVGGSRTGDSWPGTGGVGGSGTGTDSPRDAGPPDVVDAPTAGAMGGASASGGAGGGVAGTSGSAGTGGASSSIVVDYGQTCSDNSNCPSSATCCDGSKESCDQTKVPSGEGSLPGRFVISSDGLIVSDGMTGLEWQRDGAGTRAGCSGNGELTCLLDEAKAYCASLTLGGLTGWRLPGRNELRTIVDFTRVSPAIDQTVFPNTPSEPFLSSSLYAGSYDPWYVDFNHGYSNNGGAEFALRVRCVR